MNSISLARRLRLGLALGFLLASLVEADSVTRLVLVRADTDTDLFELNDGQTIDVASLPTTELNVRAETEGPTGSVRFDVDGAIGVQTENSAPYALAGDSNGDYNSWFPGPGSHTLTATPFSGGSASGTAGTSLTVTITFAAPTPAASGLVSAGPAQFPNLPQTSAMLSGSLEPGVTGTTQWSQVYGPPATIVSPASLTTEVTGLSPEAVYQFRLTLTTPTGAYSDDVIVSALGSSPQAGSISGELRQWHRIALTFAGPNRSETDVDNPFLNCRLTVLFTQGQQTIAVPGFYAADGDAAETSADSGDRWRAYFSPPDSGEWSYRALFRNGSGVAIALDPNSGNPEPSVNGAAGTFTVLPSNKLAPDFRGRGLLAYDGGRYLRFRGDGSIFLKGGADSPENFLAYEEFDGTFDAGGNFLHSYTPHLGDFNPGDPTWQGGQGQGIIGALNYLASEKMNSVYFLTMNVGGDGQDVWPWIAPNERLRYDVSKLDQWEIVFSHMDRLGIQLHVVTQETENDQLLDGGSLGTERRLYYRELVARLSHHLAIVWNLGEENTNSGLERQAFATAIRKLDPYDHPIVVHTYPGQLNQVYTPLLGFPNFEGPSIQTNANLNPIHNLTLDWLLDSELAGRPWFVCIDEPGSAQEGALPDSVDPDHDDHRVRALWGNLMAGGSGCEWYFGYGFPNDDLDCEDWRSRDFLWDQTRIALEFFAELPLEAMTSADDRIQAGEAWCLADESECLVVYLPEGGDATVSTDPGDYELVWTNPRTQASSTPVVITSAGALSLSAPTQGLGEDWAALLTQVGSSPQVLLFYETAGFTHVSQIAAGRAMFEDLAAQFGFEVTEAARSDGHFTSSALSGFDAVVFLNTTGDVLNASEQSAFESFIQNGGGYVGIHSATDTEYGWPFYGTLVGAYFQNHPPGTTNATLNVVDPNHPSTETLAASFDWTDEWYNFQSNPASDPDTLLLLTVDESTYSGGTMGDPHPISWAREVLGGRAWYTAIGHNDDAYFASFFRDHVMGGLNWVLGTTSPNGFRRGYVNGDSSLNLADAIIILNFLFANEPVVCQDAADFNDDGVLNIADPVALLSFLFSGAAPPPDPFASCGPDPTADAIDCPSLCP